MTDPFRAISLTYGPFLTVLHLFQVQFSRPRNLQFRFRIKDLEHGQQPVRRKALNSVAQDLADLRLIGAQYLGHFF